MTKGRKPWGDHALTGAERQALYRARHAAAPMVRYRRPADRRSRPQRWRDAVAELIALQAEYAAWFEALPEATRDSATGAALEAIIELTTPRSPNVCASRGCARPPVWKISTTAPRAVLIAP